MAARYVIMYALKNSHVHNYLVYRFLETLQISMLALFITLFINWINLFTDCGNMNDQAASDGRLKCI